MTDRASQNVSTLQTSQALPQATLHVEVIADFACPFCYLGKRRLESALAFVQGPSDVSWFPWQLNPDMPAEGLLLEEYLTQRFGSVAAVQPVLDSLAKEGALEGIRFDFAKLARVPNTLNAHILMALADRERIDTTALAERLMAAVFEHGEDIGKVDVLTALGNNAGMSSDAIIEVLDDEKTRQAVLAREAQARASGISGVPGFLLNRRLLLVGAQDAPTIVNAFDRAMFGEGNAAVESPALH